MKTVSRFSLGKCTCWTLYVIGMALVVFPMVLVCLHVIVVTDPMGPLLLNFIGYNMAWISGLAGELPMKPLLYVFSGTLIFGLVMCLFH
ncbi:MAG: hypothetical protein RLY66_608 [Candidatus Parcubacteria bacterium]|jgi:hypothetical protein